VTALACIPSPPRDDLHAGAWLPTMWILAWLSPNASAVPGPDGVTVILEADHGPTPTVQEIADMWDLIRDGGLPDRVYAVIPAQTLTAVTA
jgi:hypothetical protein